MIDVTAVAGALITLMSVLITVFLVPYLRSKLKTEQLAEVQIWVNIAVKAAEQLFQGSDQGKSKKQYVLDMLKKHGFTMDMEQLDQMIEAAVNDLPTLIPITGVSELQ